MNRSQARYLQVARQIQNQVEQLPSGQPLESVRALMRQYNASQGTIYKALEVLKKEKVVSQDTGRGVCAAPLGSAPNQAIGRLLVVMTGARYHQQLFAAMYSQAHEHKIRCTVQTLLGSPDELGVLALEYDALILMPNAEFLDMRTLGSWLREKRPVLTVDRDLRDIGLDSVQSNNYRGGLLAARHFAEMGHRKVAVIATTDNYATLQERRSGFVDEANSLGLSVQILKSHTRYDSHADMAKAALGDVIAKKPDFTGVFCVSHQSTIGSIELLQAKGVSIPEQLSVLGYDDLGISQNALWSISSVDQDLPLMARSILQIIRKRLDGQTGPFQEKILPVFHPRESVNDLRQSTAGRPNE